ncbi:P-loop containing nucleoside triphosphate hydrolase protein, partial [Mycena capillaripes]
LMGGTGTGKTTFINLAGRSQYIVGHGLESCTENIQSHQFIVDDCGVTLIDMPGFDDTNRSDAEILKMIADFLVAEYWAGRYLSGVLYFHRISDVRVGGASRRNLTMFKKLCGEEAFMNLAIVTTRWDEEDKAVGEARLTELETKPQLFKSILDGGGKIFQHNRSEISAHAILRHLIPKIAKPLLIQHEMAVEGRKVSETTAGQELQREVLQQMERHQKQMSELLEEI